MRFPAEAASPADPGRSAGAPGLASPALLEDLGERLKDHDLVVLFGTSALCLEAAKIGPGRTVLLPFADQELVGSGDPEIFQYPAAFVFGSETEEVLVLKRHQVHRRMRETIAGNLLLPRTADAAAFRSRTGLAGHYLIGAVPVEPGRGVEELLRFFRTFKDRHPDAALDLVLLGPAAMRVPQQPDIRLVNPANTDERLDAVAGALMAVVPERLAAFSTTAAEPFSLGVPVLVNASATELADECRASGGGLYYQNYDEFELILELGLRDSNLFARMGAAGRGFLESRHDWDRVLARYDRAFRSFARPSRGGSSESPAAGLAEPREEPGLSVPPPTVSAEAPVSTGGDAGEAPEDAETEASPDASPAEASTQPVTGASPESEPASPDTSPPAAPEEGANLEASEIPVEVEETPTPEAPDGSSAPEEVGEEDEDETGDPGLPSFFRSSIRD